MLDTSATPLDAGDDGPLRRPPPPRTWRERLEVLADATGTSPLRIAVGAVLVLVGGAAALWLLRAPAAPPEASLPFASTTAATVPASTSSTISADLVVHVAGAVVAPGIHDLPAGARVIDAVEAAGGLTPAADLTRINLAAPVADGERVYVVATGEPAPPATGDGGGPGTEAAVPGPVNINTADAAALDALPGVGPTTAAAILEHRGKIGVFTSVDQLLDVPGIGEAKLEALRDLVTV